MERAQVERLVREYRQGLEALFGDQLADVILYGSFARGEGRDDSDIDVLCVLRGPVDYADTLRRSSELTAGLSLAYGVVLSRVFVSETDLETRTLPFFMNVRRERVPA
jgi:predicted nucleotidyltransferase